MINYKCLFLQNALLFILSPALANDSTAALGAGGIVFTRSEHIAMEQEDLFVSREKIRVAYVFQNTSNKDIQTRVAFPIPEFTQDSDDSPFGYDPLSANPMHFSVIVNGKKVNFETEHKQRKDADGISYHTITHHWQQTFPAGKTLSITHEYTPVVGGSVGYGMQNEADGRFCIDADLQAWVKHQQKAHYEVPTATMHYVLTTGANWKGSIGKFRLTLKKSDPTEKLSFCGNDVKKIDERTFVMEKTHFTPKKDLHVLYLLKPYKLDE